MKRLIILFLAVLMVAGLATTAMARGGGCGRGRNYVDADGNGVCDNCGTGTGRYYVDANGDGVCDNYGTGCHRGGRWA